MSLLSVNGLRVIEAAITIPLFGAWHADLSVDAEAATPLTGALELVFDEGPVLRGFARRAAADLGRVGIRVVGGRGGLHKVLDGAHYRSVSARIPASDIVSGAGEELDGASELDAEYAHWTRLRGAAGVQLAALASAVGKPWRMTLDQGKVLIAAHTWRDAGVKDTDVLARHAAGGSLELGLIVPPGTTLLGERVTRAMITVSANGLRTRVWVDDARDG
ncbi:hypothetical protein LZC95_50215 [Pendulispora brunnea]|uniref:Uncharacterized protein n=1 Tax=Pendulispora brunnea TaxID=2905690 RepID=A0ABZ2KDY2_9BACT